MGNLVDMVLVGGDVNSTLACALAASKLQIAVAHIESGLRSFDRTMPEEVNRVLTDAISDLLFTTCQDAVVNLEREGAPKENIFFVGNTMIDSLAAYLDRARAMHTDEKFGVQREEYGLITLHRPSNVDHPEVLSRILDGLQSIQQRIRLLFPIHPRTRERLRKFRLDSRLSAMPNLHLLPPLGYLEFLGLMAGARIMLTDSGGIQEETTLLNVPCLTLRPNTERPVTLAEGTNVLVGNDPSRIVSSAFKILEQKERLSRTPALWDGKAAERIVKVLGSWSGLRRGTGLNGLNSGEKMES